MYEVFVNREIGVDPDYGVKDADGKGVFVVSEMGYINCLKLIIMIP